MLRVLVVSLVMLGAICAACGNPDDGADIFTFDPQPYITMDGGTPIAANPETCTLYPADQVLVHVQNGHVDGFVAWAGRVGFRIAYGRETALGDRTFFSIYVPVGSVPDAVHVISLRPGVIDASPNYFAHTGPAPTADPALGCEVEP